MILFDSGDFILKFSGCFMGPFCGYGLLCLTPTISPMNAFLCRAFLRDFLFYNVSDEKPDVQYADIGGMDMQKQEIREAVELPLTHFELYKQIGIDPPRGVLMYGPPGCGKTMLAKAVAHHTTGRFLSTFFQRLQMNVFIVLCLSSGLYSRGRLGIRTEVPR